MPGKFFDKRSGSGCEVISNRNQSFAYDALNRLTSAQIAFARLKAATRRECQEEVFPREAEGVVCSRHSARFTRIHLLAAHFWDKQNARSVRQPWFYPRLWLKTKPYSFVGLCRGGIGWPARLVGSLTRQIER
jgi:hypothetical protein